MTAISSSIEAQRFQDVLARMRPDANPAIVGDTLKQVALETAAIAARDKIKRGGKGSPLPNKLTSRTGTGRRSIGVNLGGIPQFSEAGTTLGYMAAHELGGRFVAGLARVKEHQRTVVFGNTVSPFTVPAYTRSAYSFVLPPRPFLGPASDDVVKKAPTIAITNWEKHVG